jgi:hypothetical protein
MEMTMGKVKRLSPAPGGGKVMKTKSGMPAGQVGTPMGKMGMKIKPKNIGMQSGGGKQI